MQNLSYENELYLHENTVADSDLQIRGGSNHPDPKIWGGGAGLKKNKFRPPQKKKFRPFGPPFGLKIRGGGGVGLRAPPLDPPFRNKRSFSDQ